MRDSAAGANILRTGSAFAQAELLARLSPRIALSDEAIRIEVTPDRLAAVLKLGDGLKPSAKPIVLTAAVTKVRKGHQLRLVIPGSHRPTHQPLSRDEKLVALISEAHAARQMLLASPEQSINSLATAHGRCRTRLGQLIRLSCLAPEIVRAVVEGCQPPTLTTRLLLGIELPLGWTEQRRVLGFS